MYLTNRNKGFQFFNINLHIYKKKRYTIFALLSNNSE